jgi:cell wall-associated NlpC family hydrolase
MSQRINENKETFADITAEFIGKPWSDTGIGPGEYNCIGFCYAFLKRLGKTVDDEIWINQKINSINYMEWREKETKATIEWLINVFLSLGDEISVNKKLPGDFVLWMDDKKKLHPGIYGGTGQIMTSVRNKGVRTLSVDNKIITIAYVRRLK